jgi:hypothetical protein
LKVVSQASDIPGAIKMFSLAPYSKSGGNPVS